MSDLRFLLDENVPRPVMRFLQSQRNHVEYVSKGVKNSREQLFLIEKVGFKVIE